MSSTYTTKVVDTKKGKPFNYDPKYYFLVIDFCLCLCNLKSLEMSDNCNSCERLGIKVPGASAFVPFRNLRGGKLGHCEKNLINHTFSIMAAALMAALCGPAVGKVGGPCVNCHTMHNS